VHDEAVHAQWTVAEVVGSNIAALRTAAGVSLAELAATMTSLGLGWARQTAADVEAGHRQLTIEELVAVAAYFDMPVTTILASPGSSITWQSVRLGNRDLDPGTWLNLTEQPRTYTEPPRGRFARTIDELVGHLDRPWSRIWRERGGHPAESFAEAWPLGVERRGRAPGPIFLWEGEGPLVVSTDRPPWHTRLDITLKPGEPYTARDEIEAKAIQGRPQVRRISGNYAWVLRKRARETKP